MRKIGFFYQSDKNFTKREVFEKGIEVIINLSASAEDRTHEFYPFIEYYKIPIEDCRAIKKNIIEAIFWLTLNKKSLIYCYNGINRSVAVIYHLQKMLNYPITLEEIKKELDDEDIVRCEELLELE